MPSEDRPSEGQGQECLRPRTNDTGASVFKKKKKVFKKLFKAIFKKMLFAKFPQDFWRFSTKFLTIQKIVLPLTRGQGNFRELEALGPKT